METKRTSPLSGTRVLIVEDEYYLAQDLSRTLVEAGAEVVGPVGSLQDAMGEVDAGAFDYAVVDMNLRGEFVFDLANRLQAAGTPFVVATGYNEASLPDELVGAPRIEKPFAPNDVVDMLVEMREKVT